MRDPLKTGFAPRLEAAAAAKKALVEQLRPRASVTDPQHGARGANKAAELAAVREGRVAAREATRATAAALLEAREAQALESKRGDRRERKALSKIEAKAKRDARYAARKARR